MGHVKVGVRARRLWAVEHARYRVLAAEHPWPNSDPPGEGEHEPSKWNRPDEQGGSPGAPRRRKVRDEAIGPEQGDEQPDGQAHAETGRGDEIADDPAEHAGASVQQE
jgi:hypothetical protein